MNHLKFTPAANYGQPSFGCSPYQRTNHNQMCNYIDEDRNFANQSYHFYNKKLPHYYIDQQPRKVYDAVHVKVAINRGSNYWQNNLVNF